MSLAASQPAEFDEQLAPVAADESSVEPELDWSVVHGASVGVEEGGQSVKPEHKNAHKERRPATPTAVPAQPPRQAKPAGAAAQGEEQAEESGSGSDEDESENDETSSESDEGAEGPAPKSWWRKWTKAEHDSVFSMVTEHGYTVSSWYKKLPAALREERSEGAVQSYVRKTVCLVASARCTCTDSLPVDADLAGDERAGPGSQARQESAHERR